MMIKFEGDPIERGPTKTTVAALRLAIARKPKGNDKAPGNAKSATAIIVTEKRGRPPTGKALTGAQRQAKFKALRKATNG